MQSSGAQLFRELSTVKTLVLNSRFFHVLREEKSTLLCYDVDWTFGLGKAQDKTTDGGIEPRDFRTIFLKQTFLTQGRWSLRSLDISDEVGSVHLKEFRKWLGNEYPDLTIRFAKDKPETFQIISSLMFSGVFFMTFITLLLGTLTRFRVVQASHAAWLLIWMYGCSVTILISILTRSILMSPCYSLWKWSLFTIKKALELIIYIGTFGGITVVGVELFESLCGTPISLPPRIWILIGFLILFACWIFTTSTNLIYGIIFYSELS